jgi:nucleoid DNA-binding protein
VENNEYNRRKSLISSKVEELLSKHDCVIILFNAQLKTDDGMLVQEVKSALGIEFSEARNWVSEFANLMIDRIMAGERTELQRVGTFTVDPERNIRFQKTEHVNFLSSAYGLFPVQASPILKAVEYTPRVIALPNNETTSKTISFKSFRKLAVAAAAACVLGFGLILSPEVKSDKLTEFSVFSAASAEAVAMRPKIASNLSRIRQSTIADKSLSSFTAETARIYIVAGCYATQENAEGVISYLVDKGFDAFILDKTPGGLHRVVYGSYTTVSEASDELISIRKGFNEEAWMLVR